MSEFITLKLSQKVTGDSCHLIPPLKTKVRQWGDGTTPDILEAIIGKIVAAHNKGK